MNSRILEKTLRFRFKENQIKMYKGEVLKQLFTNIYFNLLIYLQYNMIRLKSDVIKNSINTSEYMIQALLLNFGPYAATLFC